MKTLKVPCHTCSKPSATKLRMMWTDKTHTYKNSKRAFIMSAYYYLCKTHLKEKTKS